jgi:hypothetical protein
MKQTTARGLSGQKLTAGGADENLESPLEPGVPERAGQLLEGLEGRRGAGQSPWLIILHNSPFTETLVGEQLAEKVNTGKE